METLTPSLPETLASKTDYLNRDDHARLEAAYGFAEAAHRGVKRRSGEPYITHPVAVAELLAEMQLDADALIAGLLHDTVEDTEVTLSDIGSSFGEPVRRIVEGETKISKLKMAKLGAAEDEQAENLRQMLLAMVSDVRIIIVKLADRLHNMRTLAFMPPGDVEGQALEAEALLQHGDAAPDVGLALGAAHPDLTLQGAVAFGLAVEKAEFFEFTFNVVNAQAVRERRKDLQRFAGDALLFFRRHELKGPHVVQTVGELDNNDANVADHRQQHLPQVFGLLVLVDRVELRDL